MKVERRGKSYSYRKTIGGRQVRITLPASGIREAQRQADRIEYQMESSELVKRLADMVLMLAIDIADGRITEDSANGPAAMIRESALKGAAEIVGRVLFPPPLTCADLWERYDRAATCKEATKKGYRTLFRAFERFAGTAALDNYPKTEARRFLDSSGLQGQSRNNYISALSAVWSASPEIPNPWTAELRAKNVVHAEAAELDVAAFRQILAWLDSSESSTLDTKHKDWAKLLRVMYYTGLRPSDAVRLNASQIVGGRIELKPEKTSRTQRKISIAISDTLNAIIASLAPENGLYFPNLANRQSYDLTHAVETIIRLSGAAEKSFRLYDLRHYYATWHIDNGDSEADVSASMGHASSKTTLDHYYQGKKNISLAEMPMV